MGLHQSKQQILETANKAAEQRLSSSLSSLDRVSLIEMHLRHQQQQQQQQQQRMRDEEIFQARNSSEKPRWYVEDITTASTEPARVTSSHAERFRPEQHRTEHRRRQYERYRESHALPLCDPPPRSETRLFLPPTHLDFHDRLRAPASTVSSSSSSRCCDRQPPNMAVKPKYFKRERLPEKGRDAGRYVEFGHEHRKEAQSRQRRATYETAASAEGTSGTQVLCVNTPDSVAMFMEKFESDVKLLLPYCYRHGLAEASIALCFVSRLTVQDREASQKDTCRFFPRFQASQRDFYFRLIPVGSQDGGLFVVEYYNMPEYRQPTYVFDTHCWIEIEALLRLFFQQGYRYLMKLFPEHDLLAARSDEIQHETRQSHRLRRSAMSVEWSSIDSSDGCGKDLGAAAQSKTMPEGSVCNTCSRSWSTSVPMCAEDNFLSRSDTRVLSRSAGFQ